MFLKIAAVAVAVAALLVAAKDGRIPGTENLVARCSEVATPTGQTGVWQACRAGVLEGRPSLIRHGCASGGLVGDSELWRCPERVVGSKAPRT
jgi:hypothetical protein